MNFYGKKIFLLLLLCGGLAGLLATTVPGVRKILPEYDEFVLRNKLYQDICPLLVDKLDWEKEEIIQYVNSDTKLVPFPSSLKYSDKSFIDGIRDQIQALSYLSSYKAEEKQQLVSACLKSLPKRGIKYTWTTILYCFTLAEKKILNN